MGERSDPNNYKRTSKKSFITWTIIIGVTELLTFVYFYFACERWADIGEDQQPDE